MKPISLKQVVDAVGGKVLQERAYHPESIIRGVSIDSRNMKKENLFVAIEGQKFDGHDFITTACTNGAVAVIAHKEIKECPVPVIMVQDTLKALQDLAKYYLSTCPVKKIAVTGSTGKTTTKEMIANALETTYKVAKTLGNFNNHIGLPLSIFSIEEEHQAAVFEMGMNNPGEIDLLAAIVKPDIAVITNIGLSHIENLGSRANIMKAKLEITHYFSPENILIINNDDDMLRRMEEPSHYKLVRVGTQGIEDYVIKKIDDLGEKGIVFSGEICHNTKVIKLNVPGRHNAHNAMLALAVAHSMGIDSDKAIDGLKTFKGSAMRLILEKGKNGTKVINDVYNASPDSMKAAIDTLMAIEGKRHVAILSDMLEMGSFAQEYHENIGRYIREKNIDIVITVGDKARYISEQAVPCHHDKQVYHYPSNDDLLKNIRNILSDGDIILVKGSRSMKMEEIVDYILER